MMLKKSSQQVKRVLEAGEVEDKVEFIAVALVENTVMRLATSVKVVDMQHKKEELAERLRAMESGTINGIQVKLTEMYGFIHISTENYPN